MKNIYVRITAWLAGPFSSKISKFTQNAYVMAIQNGFQTVLPMILVGSIASLINTLRNFWEWVPDLSLVNQYSFGLIGIFWYLYFRIISWKIRNRIVRNSYPDLPVFLYYWRCVIRYSRKVIFH